VCVCVCVQFIIKVKVVPLQPPRQNMTLHYCIMSRLTTDQEQHFLYATEKYTEHMRILTTYTLLCCVLHPISIYVEIDMMQ
jgi:hypothetical protein